MKYIGLYGLLLLSGKAEVNKKDMIELAKKLEVPINEQKLGIVLDELRKFDLLEKVQKGDLDFDYAYFKLEGDPLKEEDEANRIEEDFDSDNESFSD